MGCTGSKSAAAVEVERTPHAHEATQVPRSASLWSLGDASDAASAPGTTAAAAAAAGTKQAKTPSSATKQAKKQKGKRSRVSPASSAHSGRSGSSGHSSAGSWASPSRRRCEAHSAGSEASADSADSGIDDHVSPAGPPSGAKAARSRGTGRSKGTGKGKPAAKTIVTDYMDTTVFQVEEGFGSASDSGDDATALEEDDRAYATRDTPARRGSKGDVFGQSCGEAVLKTWDFAHAGDPGAGTTVTVSTHESADACELGGTCEPSSLDAGGYTCGYDDDANTLHAPTADRAFAMEGTEPTTDQHARLHADVLREGTAGTGGAGTASRAQVRFAAMVAEGGGKRDGANSRARGQAPLITTDYSRPQTPGGLAFEITFEGAPTAKPAHTKTKPARLASLAKGPEWKRKHPDLTKAKLEKKLRAAEERRRQHTRGVVRKMTAEMSKLEAAKTLFMQERTSILQSVTRSEDKATQNRERHLKQLQAKLRAKEEKAKRVRENKELRAMAELGAGGAGAATACAY